MATLIRSEEARQHKNAHQREYSRRIGPQIRYRSPEATERRKARLRYRWANDHEWRARKQRGNKKAQQKVKLATFRAYGGVFCACCGETEILFLSLDHIHNNGADERRRLKCRSGMAFYLYLKRLKYPPGYQVLCMNCNFGKRMNKGVCCPHEGQVWGT